MFMKQVHTKSSWICANHIIEFYYVQMLRWKTKVVQILVEMCGNIWKTWNCVCWNNLLLHWGRYISTPQ